VVNPVIIPNDCSSGSDAPNRRLSPTNNNQEIHHDGDQTTKETDSLRNSVVIMFRQRLLVNTECISLFVFEIFESYANTIVVDVGKPMDESSWKSMETAAQPSE
jgi:hypothetical protein